MVKILSMWLSSLTLVLNQISVGVGPYIKCEGVIL